MLENLISFFNHLPVETMFAVEFCTSVCLLLCFLKYFNLFGLYAFIISGLFVVNIQVLKIVEFSFYPDPVALGKVMICCVFLAMDIIVECYGKEQARRAIWLGFLSNIMTTLVMFITIGYKPVESNDPSYSIFSVYNESTKNIFLPIPSILMASITSYLISQYMDVYIFSKLKEKTRSKYLWLRAFVAPAFSSFFDNIIFYSLAFYFFSSTPLDIKVLVYTYIFGTYFFRVSLIFVSSYIIYIAKWIVESNAKKLSPGNASISQAFYVKA